MLYVFKSAATADLRMTQVHGEGVLRALGREPAPQGIVLPEQVPPALAALDAAIVEEEAAFAALEEAARAEGGPLPQRPAVMLRQRAWPLRQALERAAAAGKPLVWGV